jgi:lysozyme family protein
MADLSQSLKLLLVDEGGYVDDPNDAGGETYCGIARTFQPTWPGWALITAHKAAHTCLDQVLAKDTALQGLVSSFYRDHFWRFDSLPQPVADKLLSLYVLHGVTGGEAILSQALARLDLHGPDLIAEAARCPADPLLHAIRCFAAISVAKDVAERPSQAEFLSGWMWRAVA